MLDFARATMRALSRPWLAWVGLLLVANVFAPLFFLRTIEAWIVLVAGAVSGLIQMIIFRARGFVRLLGIGHAPWIPLVAWLATRLPDRPAASAFGLWIVAVIVLNSLSLLIDAIDVARYARGERAPAGAAPPDA